MTKDSQKKILPVEPKEKNEPLEEIWKKDKPENRYSEKIPLEKEEKSTQKVPDLRHLPYPQRLKKQKDEVQFKK